MKNLCLIIIVMCFFSCGNERILELPQVENAKITEVTDVSHAYLFYDETKEDSIDLNRKNLIGTTNWLINVDKRLTLEQAIPKIIFLQDKKRNAKMHKNEDAKTYYTCNDTSIQNLGFLEFTDVNYQRTPIQEFFNNKRRDETTSLVLNMISETSFSIELSVVNESNTNVYSKLNDMLLAVSKVDEEKENMKVYFLFNGQLSFQDYISLKSAWNTKFGDTIPTDHNEFIY